MSGGNNYWPSAYSPKTKLVYIPALTNCVTITIDRAKHNKELGWNGGLSQTPDRWESSITAVDLQRGANAERVPGAVRVPLALSRPNSIARWDSGERIGHADFEAVWLKDQGVRIMQAAPTTGDVDGPQPGDVSDLIDGRRSPEFDE